MAYIDSYKHEFGVEPICRALRAHDIQIAPSTYYAAKARLPSRRSRGDEKLLVAIHRVHVDSRGLYGVRKVWKALEREGSEAGRDRVARVMRIAGLRGVMRRASAVPRGKSVEVAIRPKDLVERCWSQGAPDRVWISDFTHVKTKAGWAYTSFLQDAERLEILGFVVRTHKMVDLVIDTVNQAVSTRKRSTPTFVSEGVIHHSDVGSQPRFKGSLQQLPGLHVIWCWAWCWPLACWPSSLLRRCVRLAMAVAGWVVYGAWLQCSAWQQRSASFVS